MAGGRVPAGESSREFHRLAGRQPDPSGRLQWSEDGPGWLQARLKDEALATEERTRASYPSEVSCLQPLSASSRSGTAFFGPDGIETGERNPPALTAPRDHTASSRHREECSEIWRPVFAHGSIDQSHAEPGRKPTGSAADVTFRYFSSQKGDSETFIICSIRILLRVPLARPSECRQVQRQLPTKAGSKTRENWK